MPSILYRTDVYLKLFPSSFIFLIYDINSVSLYIIFKLFNAFKSLAYINIYSIFFFNFLSSPPPEAPALTLDITDIKFMKLFSPKTSSHKSFNCDCSLSSIEIHINPLSVKSLFAIDNLLYINESHLLCLYPSSVSKNVSSYIKSLFPVL